jgi:putative tryptophan/tyrosine transport system substrate-binding protein
MFDMRRREFITLLGGAAAWPLEAVAQQREGVRKIGVLLGITESDPDAQARAAAFREGLRELGWIEGRNLQIEFYWRQALGDDRARAADLMAFAPDVIVTNNPFVISLLQVRAIPIVFVQDRLALGLVAVDHAAVRVSLRWVRPTWDKRGTNVKNRWD